MCWSIWPATRITPPSRTGDWSSCEMAECVFATRIIPTTSKARSCPSQRLSPTAFGLHPPSSVGGLSCFRRFLMHTLPSGFVRIRYYGFLANRHRNERLEECRRLLGVTSVPTSAIQESQTPAETSDSAPSPKTCPACRRQSLAIIDIVPPARPLPLRRPHFLIHRTTNSLCFDTS